MNEKFRSLGITAFLGGVFGLLAYGYLGFSETGRLPGMDDRFPTVAAAMLMGALFSIGLNELNRRLDRWLPWGLSFATRFISGYFLNVLLGVGIVLGSGWLFVNLFGNEFFFQEVRTETDLILKVIILCLTSVFLYDIVYALLYSYQHYATAQIEGLRNERRQLELQFEALKSQISPHYLFNSLNTISSLLYKDLPSAEQFIRRLAQTYQYVLATHQKKSVYLKEEVDFVQSYYYLLRIRFQQQLTVEINLPSNVMNTLIPPLTLQMLVENAIKHNSPEDGHKLFIYITAQDNTHLRVTNTKSPANTNADSFKVGLENIRRRYAYFTTRKIEVRDEDRFTVSLPVLHQIDEGARQKHSA